MTASKLFKLLTPLEIQRVMAHLYGSQTVVVSCVLLKGGLFNTTYLVKTADVPDGLVLRVAPVNQHLLFSFEQSMMSAEPLVYKLLGEHNIPTSEVVYHDNSLALIEREYIIFKYIPSVPMNDAMVPQEAKPALYERLGELVALLHGITHDQFGWQRPGGELAMFDRWSLFLQYFAREIAEKAADYAIFTDGELMRFLHVFADGAVFDQVRTPSMVHADLWEGNILVGEHKGVWDVRALIDVDKVVLADRVFEFAFPTLLNERFLQGYGWRVGDDTAEGMFRRNSYRLLESFMYAYVWRVQLDDDERYQATKKDSLSTLALF